MWLQEDISFGSHQTSELYDLLSIVLTLKGRPHKHRDGSTTSSQRGNTDRHKERGIKTYNLGREEEKLWFGWLDGGSLPHGVLSHLQLVYCDFFRDSGSEHAL